MNWNSGFRQGLSVLKGMPLENLTCDFVPARDTAMLRAIPTLQKINGKPATEFWTIGK